MVKANIFLQAEDMKITEQMFSVIRLLLTFALHSACQSDLTDHQFKCLGLDYGLTHFFFFFLIGILLKTSANITPSI